MAQVTYRGVSYDTDAKKTECPSDKSTLTYRGIKFEKKVVSAS